MEFLHIDKYLAAINSDPEFTIAARYWNSTLKFIMGESVCMVVIKDGRLCAIDPNPGLMNDWDFDFYISAPKDEWKKLLDPVPKPFYQAVLPAAIYHGFSFGGDFETFCAYYRALSRMIEIMRYHTADQVEDNSYGQI